MRGQAGSAPSSEKKVKCGVWEGASVDKEMPLNGFYFFFVNLHNKNRDYWNKPVNYEQTVC